jgi:hypothetical protein
MAGHGSSVFQATDQEWVVVNSFAMVEPTIAYSEPEFYNWTQAELYVACHRTDCMASTTKSIFETEETSRKMRMYVASFDGACSVLTENRETLERGLRLHSLEETVMEWAGGIDPVTHVIVMKRRMERMVRKMTIMKNTIDVWKWDADKHKKKCLELEKKIRFMKKR